MTSPNLRSVAADSNVLLSAISGMAALRICRAPNLAIVTTDANQAVRRLAVMCLRHGSPQRETIVLLNGLAEDDEQEQELRNAARTTAAELKKRAGPKG